MLTLLQYGANMLKRVVKNKKGQAMVEYGLIIALIAVVVIVVLVVLGGQLGDMFQSVSDDLGEAGFSGE